MATSMNENLNLNSQKTQPTSQLHNNNKHCHWYSPETGIYQSKHPPVNLPKDPFLDVVSHIFSQHHHGVSALIDSTSGHTIPYSHLYPLVKSIASGLHQMGISQGDVVLILLPNSVYFPIIVFGVLYLGAIVTTMNPLSTLSEIKKQALDSKAILAFTLPDCLDKIRGLGIPAIGVPETGGSDLKQMGLLDFDQLIGGQSPNSVPNPTIHQEDTAVILYSSGTTGTSKGVVLSHRNLISMIELFVRFEASQYEYSSDENVYLAVMPMFHIYGLSYFVLGLFSLGSTIVVMRKFDANEMVKAIERYKVTHVTTVPPLLAALTEKAKSVEGSVWKSLKQVCCGAAPVTKKSIEDFVQTLPHVDFIQGYGMTESTAVGTRGFNTEKNRKYTSMGLMAPNMEARVVDWVTGSFMPPGRSGELWFRGPAVMKVGSHGFNTEKNRKYTSMGLMAPNMEARVVDWVTGSFMPPGRSGELWFRGPAVMKGYLNNEEATATTVDEHGWMRTGDIVYFDEEGYLHILDRLKEIIKYKGFQIAPAELEAVLATHPDILDAAVTGAKDEEAGEVPVAFVLKRHGSLLSEAAVLDYVATKVAPYKKVRKVVFTQSIPRSAAGKILRRELRSLISRI